jgi:hypothetical protein
MEMDFDHKVFAYYYSVNKLGYNRVITGNRRFKIWCIKNIALITDIEFVLEEKQELKPGELKEVGIRVVNDAYFIELLQSGYRIFFGQIGDVRFGEIIGIN